MAERRHSGLFSACSASMRCSRRAYGNVGSSIYYALGLVASFALGLTPVVFILTGVIFYLTAATYAEATAMFPEAGGSSSFARHAFNEFWSFFAAWGQMLNYVITFAISAFFVPHYIGGLFWPFLKTSPGDVIFGDRSGRRSVRDQHRRRERGGTAQHPARRSPTSPPSCCWWSSAACWCFRRQVLVHNVHLGIAPTLEGLPDRDPGRDDRLHRDRDDLEHGRGGQGPSRERFRPRSRAWSSRCLRSTPRCRRSRCRRSRCAVATDAARRCSASRRTEGGFAGDPVLGIVKHLHLGAAAARRRDLRRSAGRDDPVHRHQRRDHRGLPARVLDGPPPAGAGRLRRLHPRFRTPWIGIIVFGGVACLTLIPGQADFLGNMYAFGAMLSFTIAHLSVIRLRITQPDHVRPYRRPGHAPHCRARRCRCSRSSADSGRSSRS